MKRILRFLLTSQLKLSHQEQSSGFTLIELLVALLIAFLVITPLLGIMLTIMSTDTQEQAKATTEQEIQAALDYIARDLQQAVYIYDSAGVNAINTTNPSGLGLPFSNSTDRVPVLVFWKRELVNQVIPIATNQRDDTYVYSLVAYYLIKDTNTNTISPSNAARIARWQIRDGVPTSASTGADCPGYTGKYVSVNSIDYCPDAGFAPFNLDGTGTLEEKMNAWKRLSQYTTKNAGGQDVVNTVNYSNTPITLLYYIDQTTTNAPVKVACPTGTTLVAPNTTNFNTRTTFSMTSFYACIDRADTTAQVFIRGNALARLQSNNLSYQDTNRAYFPTASITVQGRGILFTK
ncbi:hormogonium polysaccharide secretion pseudopilin HpsC [Nostoc sp. MS1]|uniref:hormogonium polysaccharide secretion pseudopilin HpsC n=1 Tax=Nostoc sp. MS1 TaxID=2764711 RepID=UPI001CC34A74|nr:hormogonium polysaccharide secretion pseudopilin HpsC [Nostoc sp. MS1]BCL37900.1 hypothetical protein NSMS1_43470 [Nostoc sp. MS1]